MLLCGLPRYMSVDAISLHDASNTAHGAKHGAAKKTKRIHHTISMQITCSQFPQYCRGGPRGDFAVHELASAPASVCIVPTHPSAQQKRKTPRLMRERNEPGMVRTSWPLMEMSSSPTLMRPARFALLPRLLPEDRKRQLDRLRGTIPPQHIHTSGNHRHWMDLIRRTRVRREAGSKMRPSPMPNCENPLCGDEIGIGTAPALQDVSRDDVTR